MRRTAACLTLSAATVLGCTSGFDRNDQIVNNLRILGVGAHVDDTTGMNIDWADADVGETVHLKSLVASPGGLSTVTVTWLACLPIQGKTQPCTDEVYLRDPASIIPLANDTANTGVLSLGTGVNIDYTIPMEVQPLLQGLLDRADANVNAECALYAQIPMLVIAQDSATGDVFAAEKTLRLSPWKEIAQANNPKFSYYVRNRNPQIAGFNLSPTGTAGCDGQSLAQPCVTDKDCAMGATCTNGACSGAGGGAFPDGVQVICLNVEQADSYYTCGLDGPQIDNPSDPPNVPERPNVTWYMTAGSLSDFASPTPGSGGSVASRTFTQFTRAPGPFTIYGVARDGRDGQTWIAQDFQ